MQTSHTHVSITPQLFRKIIFEYQRIQDSKEKLHKIFNDFDFARPEDISADFDKNKNILIKKEVFFDVIEHCPYLLLENEPKKIAELAMSYFLYKTAVSVPYLQYYLESA